MAPTVGFVGLGNMGSGMAANLLKVGFPVLGYDISPEAVAALVRAGGKGAASVRELGAKVDTAVVMVLTFPQMQEVMLGENGLAATMRPGSAVIGCSSIAPEQAKVLGAGLAERGINYLDCPVTGGKSGAHEGTLTIMVGADPEVFAAQRPVLEGMSARLFHCGPVGMGQVAKLCNQIMCGSALVATAECLAFGSAAGIDLKTLYEVITHGTGDGWMFRHRADRMMARDFETRGRLDIFTKDLGNVLEVADQFHLPLLVTAAARQWVMMGVAQGHAGEDDAAVVKPIEKLSGITVRAE